jgi:hypothetical protein
MRRSFSFEFDEPLGWRTFTEGGRLVFQGPNGEELIVSGASVGGSGSASDYEGIKQALHASTLLALKRAVDTPELVVEKALSRWKTAGGLDVWSMEARSADGEVLLLQAAILSDTGTLVVTLEAAPIEANRNYFYQFCNQIRVVDEGVSA